MSFTPAEEAAWLGAYSHVARGAREKTARQAGTPGTETYKLADMRYRASRPLGTDTIIAMSGRALAAAKSTIIQENHPFPLFLWKDGVKDVKRGFQFSGTITDFAQMVALRGQAVAAKKSGWVVEPVINVDGHRTNASTTHMLALFLDCDGTGDWIQLLNTLKQLGIAYVAYQSGGWSTETPKWRIAMPLDRPVSVKDDDERAAWKRAYDTSRMIFGSLAGLRGEGFDPACSTPAQPWFLSERRNETDPARQVYMQVGHSISMLKMLMSLPPLPEEEREHTQRAKAEVRELSDAEHQRVVNALKAPTARVPSGRRDLYLALPGTLLDRGVCPDDVIDICRELSASYDGGSAEKHLDNVHCAHTTIGKWYKGELYTRIGTLHNTWPEVAAALDLVLPDPLQAALRGSIASLFGSAGVAGAGVAGAGVAGAGVAGAGVGVGVGSVGVGVGVGGVGVPPIPGDAIHVPPIPGDAIKVAASTIPSIPAIPAAVPMTLKAIRNKISLFLRKKNADAKSAEESAVCETDKDLEKKRVDAAVLRNILDGAAINLNTGVDREAAITKAGRMLGYKFPNVPWESMIEVLRKSVNGSLGEGESAVGMLQIAETHYRASQVNQTEAANLKRAKKFLTDRGILI